MSFAASFQAVIFRFAGRIVLAGNASPLILRVLHQFVDRSALANDSPFARTLDYQVDPAERYQRSIIFALKCTEASEYRPEETLLTHPDIERKISMSLCKPESVSAG